ncbi:cytochrome P450 [Archangium violaceum]|uniref:cytochrome P450 n=1 Tax=Archangium violaceum TaxID=83451 RepID=UPI00194FE1E8|nr:cytochrome P450 [Archangium violaceum]QRO02030.1 cytochrome P450 [Archangium violaceum]
MPDFVSRFLFNLFFGTKRQAFASLPGPQPGILGTAGDFLGPQQPWNVCARYGREYGGVTLIWMGSTPGLVLNDPTLIEQVLDSRRMEFEKGSVQQVLGPLRTEHSLFIALQNGDWAALRRRDPLAQPWTPDWLATQVAPMQQAVARFVDAHLGGAVVDLAPVLRRLTFDVFGIALFGETPPDSFYEDFMWLSHVGDGRFKAKIPLKFVPLPKGFETVRNRFFKYCTDRVDAARRSPKPDAVDLLSRTLREVPDFPDEALAHTLSLYFPSGVFSSSTNLVGALHQLQMHPGAEAHLASESFEFSGGPPTFKRLDEARWVEAVVLESLRLLPPVRLFMRTPVKDMELAGVPLPAGATIMISNQHLHRDPAHWPHPDTFDPARWFDGGVERDPIGSGHFFPFGRGPRMCMGAEFAMVYMRTALATIAARAKVHVESADPYKEGFFHGVVLPEGVHAKFVRR